MSAKSKTPENDDTKSAPIRSAEGATPSMAQYLEIKAANPDSLLWYRMGDFYELFFEDAEVAAKALGIVLTKRGKHLGEDIAMCGVPVHKSDEYLQKLIKQGYRVAVCEQLEDPVEARKRGSKAVVHRDVVRLVTPGTLTEDALLDSGKRNFLTALFAVAKDKDNEEHDAGSLVEREDNLAIASVDISTGEFEVGEIQGRDLPGELIRLSPSEVIGTERLLGDLGVGQWITVAGAAPTSVPTPSFDSLSGERQLKEQLGVTDLQGFGTFSRAMLAAVGSLLRYIDLTQIGKRPLLRPPRIVGHNDALLIDAASRASLELIRATNGEKRGSLLHAIDRTVTGAGARELSARLASPIVDHEAIEARLDEVAYLIDHELLRETLRTTLVGTPDVARAMSRLSFGRGGPRDLAGIRDGLEIAAVCANALHESSDAIGLPQGLAHLVSRMGAAGRDLKTKLDAALVDAPPHLKRDGGFVAKAFHADLDDARSLRDDSRKVMASLEAQYITQTDVKTLKIRHNNVIGYFLEVTQANSKALLEAPLNETFHHKQTMANAMRFTTTELTEIEGRIASAAERALQLEHEIFSELIEEVKAEEKALSDLATALGVLDHVAALAELAHIESYVRPRIETNRAFNIVGGRHPVVEQALRKENAAPFIANDCQLGSEDGAPNGFDETTVARLWLVTGPNMAGKSTFLRQNALIAVMAQMGSFVPAQEVTIGVIDRVFSRVGAADDLARGRSTFMVEMIETAGILNQASDRSMVILDEIGRGTATYDGLSIAWAAVEFLHDVVQCRTLFATHYHEMTVLADRLDNVTNVTMDVKEWRDDIVFLHKVKSGAADRSYGVQVAKLAGLPKPVIKRAREVLKRLEARRDGADGGAESLNDLPLFQTAHFDEEQDGAARTCPVTDRLESLNIDDMSPRAALDALYDLKALMQKDRGS